MVSDINIINKDKEENIISLVLYHCSGMPIHIMKIDLPVDEHDVFIDHISKLITDYPKVFT